MMNKLFFAVFLLIIAVVSFYIFESKRNEIPGLVLKSGALSGSAEFRNAEKSVDHYRMEIEKNPDILKNYVELAQVYMQLARTTGLDHEYIGKAMEVLNRALERNPESSEVLITKAAILLTQHRFDEAKPIAEEVISKLPYYAYAHGVLCDALVELGEYEQAVKACDKMISIRPDISSYSRASYIRELYGKIPESEDAMTKAANAGVWGSENRAWSLINLGNLYLMRGNLDTAAYIYKGILEERPDYAYALSGLAKIEIINGKYKEAEELLKKAHSVMPGHLFLEELANLYRITGNKAEEKKITAEVFAEYAHHETEKYNVDLEYVKFCILHNLNIDESFKRIQREYKRRPGNAEVLDAYAWLLHKKGESENALMYAKKAESRRIVSASLYYHTGEILYSLKKYDEASEYYKKTTKLSPYYDKLNTMPGSQIKSRLLEMNKMVASM